jgi:hypothetical protein
MQVCTFPHFGVICQRLLTADETFPFTRSTFTRGWLRRKAASERRRGRFRFQAKGLFHTSPGHSPWVRGAVFPAQANGLLHRFETMALEAEEG